MITHGMQDITFLFTPHSTQIPQSEEVPTTFDELTEKFNVMQKDLTNAISEAIELEKGVNDLIIRLQEAISQCGDST